MTWSRFDDAAPKHPKARIAGNEAWALWAAAVMYCNRYLTDGFVPAVALATECLPFPITPAKARKLAEKLCESKLRTDGAGLFEKVEGGYVVHGFLDWNPSKAEVEAKRKADRDRKRGRPSDSAPDSGGIPHGIPNGKATVPHGIPNGKHADSEAPARVPAPAAARASRPAQPPPADPHPTDGEDQASSSVDPQANWDGSDAETVCPLDLVQRAERVGVFKIMRDKLAGASVEQLRDKAQSFVAYWTIGKGMGRRKRLWMRELRQELLWAFENNKLKPHGAVEHERIESEGDGPGLTEEQRDRLAKVREELDRKLAEQAGRERAAHG